MAPAMQRLLQCLFKCSAAERQAWTIEAEQETIGHLLKVAGSSIPWWLMGSNRFEVMEPIEPGDRALEGRLNQGYFRPSLEPLVVHEWPCKEGLLVRLYDHWLLPTENDLAKRFDEGIGKVIEISKDLFSDLVQSMAQIDGGYLCRCVLRKIEAGNKLLVYLLIAPKPLRLIHRASPTRVPVRESHIDECGGDPAGHVSSCSTGPESP